MNDHDVRQARIDRLRRGNWQFGHDGRHHGNGSPECPLALHHHHDEFCSLPAPYELFEAGISLKEFHAASRSGHGGR